MTIKQKKWSYSIKVILIMILLIVLAFGIIAGLSHFGVIDIPYSQVYNDETDLYRANQKAITIEEIDVVMDNEEEGRATIQITLPDYEKLFTEAIPFEYPEQYLLNMLNSGDYDIRVFEKEADVTIENETAVIHSDEVVNQLLEELLLCAIRAVAEVEQ